MAVTLLGFGRVPHPEAARLRAIPGDTGLPVLGVAPAFVADPLALARRMQARFGPLVRTAFPFEQSLMALSAEANEFVLADRAGNFSARLGWESMLGTLFPRGLMLRDGDDHRVQRRLMTPAFRKEALSTYLAMMQPRIARGIAEWARRGSFTFYPALKRLTLEIAADIFLGLELQSEIDQVNEDFVDIVDASLAFVRVPVIGVQYGRGLRGRRRLEAFLRDRIPMRRSGEGADFFSQMCRMRNADGSLLDEQEIVDQLIFLMMAAHDTTTSALTTIVYALARHPEWQDRLHEEGAALSLPLDHDALEQLECTGWVLREALRLYPPLPTIARRAVRDCELHGHTIPVNTLVAVYPIHTQRDPQWWSAPDTFDPERFSPAHAEHKRHPFAWIPFGGGIHMCLGLHFAEMQVKAFLTPLLRDWRLVVPAGYEAPYRLAPIAKPKDGLPIRLEPR